MSDIWIYVQAKHNKHRSITIQCNQIEMLSKVYTYKTDYKSSIIVANECDQNEWCMNLCTNQTQQA